MSAVAGDWPKKTREIVSSVFDSTRWNDFEFRPDDIVIDTWAKTGTTWMQQIVAQIVLGPDAGLLGNGASPWLDMRVIPFEPMLAGLEAQSHRRFIKSHLPLDALVFSPAAKYIYVGRDGRDVAWSFFNHSRSYSDFALDAFNTPPGLAGQPMTRPACNVKTYYLQWLKTGEFDGAPGFPSFWEHAQGWWNARHLPNVHLVHFANLKADLLGEMRKIAAFLGLEIDESDFPIMAEHCGFEYMKSAAAKVEELETYFDGGARVFFNKGANGRWKDILSADEAALCDEVAARHLMPQCAHWLKTGELPEGPR